MTSDHISRFDYTCTNDVSMKFQRTSAYINGNQDMGPIWKIINSYNFTECRSHHLSWIKGETDALPISVCL